MKQNRLTKGVLTLVAVLASVFFTACTMIDVPVENTDFIKLADGASNEMTVNYQGDLVTIPIEANGEWTAKIKDSNANWLTILKGQGAGSGSVEVLIEPNDEETERSTEIEIISGTQVLTISIIQVEFGSPLFTMADNNNEYTFDHFRPLGFSIDITPKANTAFSTIAKKRIFELTESGAFTILSKGEYIAVNKTPSSNFSLKTATDFSSAQTDLNASLDVTVGYGLFKFHMEGSFWNHNEVEDTSFVYAAASTVNVGEYAINEQDYFDKYLDFLEANSTDQAKLFSRDFRNIRDQLAKSIKDKNQTVTDSLVKRIDQQFGPVYISQITRGGNVSVTATLSETESDNVTEIKGKLKADFNGAFNLSAEAEASYIAKSHSFTSATSIGASVEGGTNEAVTALQKALVAVCSGDDKITPMLAAINDWKSSLYEGEIGVVKFSPSGIWELFVDIDASIQDEMQKSIKQYMRKKYQNVKETIKDKDGKENEIERCPYLVNIQALTDDISD